MTAEPRAIHSGRPADPAAFSTGLPAPAPRSVPAIAWAALAVSALVAAVAIGGAGLTRGWPNVQLMVAAVGGVAVCWAGLRSAVNPPDRAFRFTVLVAASIWLLIQAVWLVSTAKPGLLPGQLQFLLAGALVVLVARCWRQMLGTRLSRVEVVAVYLDSASVALIAVATILLVMGPGAFREPAEQRLMLPALVMGGTLGGFLVLYLALTPRRFAGGSLAVIAGLLLLAAGLLVRLGIAGEAWYPSDLLAAIGTLLTAYGAATWTDEQDPSYAFRRSAQRIRGALPLLAVGAAPLILLGNELRLNENGTMLALTVDVAVALILIDSVLRQTLLLTERNRMVGIATAAVDRERGLVVDLQASERRFRTLVQNSSDVVLIVRPDGEVTYQSPAVERVLGYPPKERSGQYIYRWTHPDDAGFVQGVLAELARAPGAMRTIELRTRHADGSWRTVEATGKNMLDDPVIGGIVVNYRDVTERKVLESQLIHEAFHDPLTGLANRALFTDRVEHALTRRQRQPLLAVLFMDVDDFKTINDSLGHSAGDLVLVAVAERVRGCLRPQDTVSRLGGDEFAVLVEDEEFGLAAQLASRILQTLRLPFEIGGKQVQLQASIGIAHAGEETRSANDLLRNADVAMYTAKSSGKGRVAEFESSMHAAVLTRLEIKADLERAIARDELRLRFQPVFDLQDGSLAGFESLLRWRHPRRGELHPGEFIALAEETGLIVPIGAWVLEQACRQARAWTDSYDRRLTVSVNIAARQLREPDFVTSVAETLASVGLAAEHLMIELTETSLMQDDEGRLGELRAMGVRLALDDFGTGYSSLSYLSRFPIDHLKIDRSFIAQLGGEHEEDALVRSVVQLAAAMNMKTVAEGIEQPEQLARVTELGCDYGQGFLLARPMDSIRATSLLVGGASLSSLKALGA